MTLRDELHDLASALSGVSWRTKLMQEWTPEEEAAYERASAAEQMEWFRWMVNEPLSTVLVQTWREGHLVHQLSRTYHNGTLIGEHDTVGVINEGEQRWGVTGPERERYIRQYPAGATPSERAALGLTLPPAYPGIIHLDPFESAEEREAGSPDNT